MLVIEDLLRGVDADRDRELEGRAGSVFRDHRQVASVRELRLQHLRQTPHVEDLFAREAERFCGLAGLELQRQNAHADQVGAVNALEGFGDDEADAQQPGPFRGPVS